MLATIIGGSLNYIFFFYLVTWRHLLAGALMGLCGYTLGGGAALLARMNRAEVRLRRETGSLIFSFCYM